MRQSLLIIAVFLLYSCQLPNAKTQELKQLNERVTRLEQTVDSLIKVRRTDKDSLSRMGSILPTNQCAALTKKGTPCKRKATTNGYCWQHRK
jgi:hypothetical protein